MLTFLNGNAFVCEIVCVCVCVWARGGFLSIHIYEIFLIESYVGSFGYWTKENFKETRYETRDNHGIAPRKFKRFYDAYFRVG